MRMSLPLPQKLPRNKLHYQIYNDLFFLLASDSMLPPELNLLCWDSKIFLANNNYRFKLKINANRFCRYPHNL